MTKHFILKALRIMLILLIIWAVLTGGLLLALEMGSKPRQIRSLSDSELDKIEAATGIILPESAQYIDGYYYPGRDPSELYIFELPLERKQVGESDDSCLRRMLSIGNADHSTTCSSTYEFRHQSTFPQSDMSCTYEIEYKAVNFDLCHYAYIHYEIIDRSVARIVLEFGTM